MYKGFPVGYFLFWKNGLENGHKTIGADLKQKAPDSLIVDGQQRLTSLFAVIMGIPVIREDFRTEKILIAFNPLTETFEVADVTIGRNPEYISDVSTIWDHKNGIFGVVDDYVSRLKLTRSLSDDEIRLIQKSINNLDNISKYPFTVLEVTKQATEEQVSDIFVRVNSKGTPLNQADFILTLMSVFWEDGRKQLEDFCRQSRIPPLDKKPTPFNYFIQPDPDHLLRTSIGFGFKRAALKYAYLILRGKDLETEQFSSEQQLKQFEILKNAQDNVINIQNWHDFLKAILSAGYVSNQMIISQNGLMYSYVFYLIGKYDFCLDHKELRKVIARWFFMTAITSRYSGSFESIMEQDLNRLREVKSGEEFVTLIYRIIDDAFTDDYWNIGLPNQLETTSSAHTPVLSAYYAALINLNAQVLFSTLRVVDLLDPKINARKSAIEKTSFIPEKLFNFIGIKEVRGNKPGS